MSEFYKNALSESEIKKVESALYNYYDIRNDVASNVNAAVGGLDDLLHSLEKIIKSVENKSDISFYNLDYLKMDFDKIVYIMKNFEEKFEPLYDAFTQRYIAEKLIDEENKNKDSLSGSEPMSFEDGSTSGKTSKKWNTTR